jgi:hypothetical protein
MRVHQSGCRLGGRNHKFMAQTPRRPATDLWRSWRNFRHRSSRLRCCSRRPSNLPAIGVDLKFTYASGFAELEASPLAALAQGQRQKGRMTVMPIRPGTVLLSCAIAGLVVSAALAQTADYMSVEATAGKPLQLSYHASAHKSNCTPAPLATFDVLQAPKRPF